MKLIYLANIGLPANWAHEIQIMKMCEAFALAGAEVELVVPKRKKNTGQNIYEFYNVAENFKITQLPCFDLKKSSASRLVYWLKAFSFFRAAQAYLRGKKYDILYTREQLAGRFFKDFVLEIHFLPEPIRPFHKKIWQRTKFLVVITSYLKTALVSQGLTADRVSVAPDGVNIDEFDPSVSQSEARQKTDLPPDKKIVLYAGSFYLRDWKGVDILLEAAKQLDKDSLLVLVGGEKTEIENIKKQYPLPNLLLIERQPHHQIPYYLKAADVLVLPNKKGETISEKYTSPMKLFEYLAAGRPIVASDLPSIREVLSEAEAMLVQPNDPKALADGIKKLLSDNGLAEKIARSGRQKVESYSWQGRAKNILNFYGEKNSR